MAPDPDITERLTAASENMFSTALATRRIIKDSRELLARVDAILARDLLCPVHKS